jgi:large-conductance mechanosensitive channel
MRKKLKVILSVITIIIAIIAAIYPPNYKEINKFLIKNLTITYGLFILSILISVIIALIIRFNILRYSKINKTNSYSLKESKKASFEKTNIPIQNETFKNSVLYYNNLLFWCQLRIDQNGPIVKSFTYNRICPKCQKPIKTKDIKCIHCFSKQYSGLTRLNLTQAELEKVLFFKFIEKVFPDFYSKYQNLN